MDISYVLDTSFIAHIEQCFRNNVQRQMIFDYLTNGRTKKAYALFSEIIQSENDRSWVKSYVQDITTKNEETLEFIFSQSENTNQFIRNQITTENINDVTLIHFAYADKNVRVIVSDAP